MQSRNVSDIIEKYLKSIMTDGHKLEIKRSEIAQRFNVVPSQINYVIKTRFSLQNGYIVESKRGGGGYIRILKVNLIDNVDVIDDLIKYIGNRISASDGYKIVNALYEDEILTKKEANIILATISQNTLTFSSTDIENQVRAKILISILDRLRCE